MKLIAHRLLALGLTALLALTSCGTEIGGAFYIVGNTVPETSTCLVQAQGGGGQQKFRSSGVLDLSVRSSYVGYLLVVNQAPQFETVTGFAAEDGRLDQSMIVLDRAEVTMSMAAPIVSDHQQVMGEASLSMGLTDSIWGTGQTCNAKVCTTNYTIPISGELQPGGTAAVIFDMLPDNYGRILRHLPIWVQAGESAGPADVQLGNATLNLLFEVTLHGARHDGTEVSSEGFNYSVEVCSSCMVRNEFPPQLALNPLAPPQPFEPIEIDELVADLCAPGSDEQVSNAWCSVAFALGSCQQERCLSGVGQPTPNGSDLTLYCPDDGVTYGPLTL